MNEKEYEFWPDKVAKELVRKWKVEKQVITTGTSISGEPHIGNAGDVIRGDAIYRAVKDLGKEAELIWISDNMDPFRSVPQDMPKDLENYLGMPASSIPDFWSCHESFTKHFEDIFLKQLESIFIKPKVLLGNEMYEKGMYNEVMKKAMEKRKEIAEILNKFRKNPLPEDWYPVEVICDNCGKIATTKILSYDEESCKVEYFCDPKEVLLHRKNPVQGCSNRGVKSILNGGGKLVWRVEWPARWVFLKTTCEPFGKEHAAAGGSWDVGKEIVKLLGWKPPYPIVYEHFLVNGEKMSKSRGNVITVSDMLQYMKPEHLRYWMFQGRLTIAKDINLKNMIPKLFNEFALAEKIYFGKESTGNKRKDKNYKRAYELAKVKIPEKNSLYIPFEKLEEIVKILPEENEIEFAIHKLREMQIIEKISEEEREEIIIQLNFVKKWYENFVKPKVGEIVIDEKTKKAIEILIKTIREEEEGEKLQIKIFSIAKENGIDIKEFFKTIYMILIGLPQGPKLGPYIIEVGKEEVINKLEKAIK